MEKEKEFSKSEIRAFKAIERIKEKHPKWTDRQAIRHLIFMRYYSAFLKWRRKQPDYKPTHRKSLTATA